MQWREKSNLHLKFFGKDTQALVISKTLSSPRMTEQIQILQRRLEYFTKHLKYSGQPKKCYHCIQEENVVGCP